LKLSIKLFRHDIACVWILLWN